MKGTEAWLRTNPAVEFILVNDATSAEPALASLSELGLSGKLKLGTFDQSPVILQAIADGQVEWAIDAQPYLTSYVPIVMLDLLAR